MSKQNNFEDPLDDIDPVLAESFAEEDQSDPPSQPMSSPEPEPIPEPNYKPSASFPTVSDVQFPVLESTTSDLDIGNDMFHNIPVNLSVELGRSQVCLKEIYELTEGSIIELDRLVGEPLDLVVNGQVIAQGEVVAIDNNYGLRVTNIVAKTNV